MTVPILSDLARPVTGGVDTHKDVHVVAVVDHLGSELAHRDFPTTPEGYEQAADWMRSHGDIVQVAMEGTSSFGAGFCRHLTANGITVVEVNRPNRQARRRHGKSDPLDAIAAARAALAGLDAGTPKTSDGPVEAIRVLRLDRQSAIRSRTKTMNLIRALVDTAPNQLRERLRHLNTTKLTKTISSSRPGTNLADPTIATTVALRNLGRRWQFLTTQITELDTALETVLNQAAPKLMAVHGVGTNVAAALLIAAGDNPERLGTEASFAALCGVSPLPASSGKTQRHRLNRGGNRAANNALWSIVMTRMSHEQRTRDYVQRRTTEGLSKPEIMRCLKRYVAREIYPIILNDLKPN